MSDKKNKIRYDDAVMIQPSIKATEKNRYKTSPRVKDPSSSSSGSSSSHMSKDNPGVIIQPGANTSSFLHNNWGPTLSRSEVAFEEVEVPDPKRYKCLVRVVGAKGLRNSSSKLFSCYVNVRIPGGLMATSSKC